MTGHVERLTQWCSDGDQIFYDTESTQFRDDLIALLAEAASLRATVAEMPAVLAATRANYERRYDPPPNTIPVRVWVLVDADGGYWVRGQSGLSEEDAALRLARLASNQPHLVHTLTAHVPLPRSVEIVADVEPGL